MDGGGEGSPIERTHFVHPFFVLKQEQYVFRFANVQNSSAWGRNYKIRPQARFFLIGDPSPPLSTLVDKMSFPLHFCILQVIKNWIVGRPKNKASPSVIINNLKT